MKNREKIEFTLIALLPFIISFTMLWIEHKY